MDARGLDCAGEVHACVQPRAARLGRASRDQGSEHARAFPAGSASSRGPCGHRRSLRPSPRRCDAAMGKEGCLFLVGPRQASCAGGTTCGRSAGAWEEERRVLLPLPVDLGRADRFTRGAGWRGARGTSEPGNRPDHAMDVQRARRVAGERSIRLRVLQSAPRAGEYRGRCLLPPATPQVTEPA